MNQVKDQYEAYPYPERNPKDEAKRLISGSPSHPLEIDHFLFAGQRDWTKPLRALAAGGGTGDGLIQLAQMLTQTGKSYEITYVDLSRASRKVAEARAAARQLKNIRFVTGSLLDAADLGVFDYIDCCGVLHHLPEPVEGFRALRAALAPEGGLGFMVYAPYGRSGVYPLQEAFGALHDGLSPKERLKAARKIVAALPEGHPFKGNPNLGDHHDSDAGFYDLLLHSQDRAFDVPDLIDTMTEAGWELSGFTMPALYDLSRITEVPDHIDEVRAMAVAEKLRGTIKTHVGYAVPAGQGQQAASGKNRALVPHLKGVQPQALAQAVAQGKAPKLNFAGIDAQLRLPKAAAPLIAAIDGRRSLSDIAQMTKTDPIGMGATWARVEAELAGWGILLYSGILR
ncbi:MULTISPECIES: bifunctional 2-polyprenyl-6-hydroxyphenol methylase/3-demethylubiquinol 3-O-methyltransferase UbiG [unclassified Roseovarius]|uniref:class I SAM-dependent methyltransferase n=1 Tax=unclassified Roseovarius TaxID=2614913 RepID=UPI00273F0EBB|nr:MULTISPECIES: class I SAM-dependent methyltransferase [unclassified Roseovarius]